MSRTADAVRYIVPTSKAQLAGLPALARATMLALVALGWLAGAMTRT